MPVLRQPISCVLPCRLLYCLLSSLFLFSTSFQSPWHQFLWRKTDGCASQRSEIDRPVSQTCQVSVHSEMRLVFAACHRWWTSLPNPRDAQILPVSKLVLPALPFHWPHHPRTPGLDEISRNTEWEAYIRRKFLSQSVATGAVLVELTFTWCTQLIIAFKSTMSFCSSSSDALHSKLASLDRSFSYIHKPRKTGQTAAHQEGSGTCQTYTIDVPWGGREGEHSHLVYSDVSSCIGVAILCQKTFHRPRGTGDQTFVAHTRVLHAGETSRWSCDATKAKQKGDKHTRLPQNKRSAGRLTGRATSYLSLSHVCQCCCKVLAVAPDI